MKEQLDFSWEGALADLKDQYSSVELQHKAMEWRLDEFDELFVQTQTAGSKVEVNEHENS